MTKQTKALYEAYRSYAEDIIKLGYMDTVNIRLPHTKIKDLIPDYYNPAIKNATWLQYRIRSKLRMYAIGLYDLNS